MHDFLQPYHGMRLPPTAECHPHPHSDRMQAPAEKADFLQGFRSAEDDFRARGHAGQVRALEGKEQRERERTGSSRRRSRRDARAS